MDINNIQSTPGRTLGGKNSGEKFSEAKSLNEQCGINSLLVHHETLLPGRRGSSPHYHTTKEEIFFVLEGHPSAVINNQKKQLSPGDYIGFPKSSEETHYLINETEKIAVILTMGTNPDDDEVHYMKEY